MHFSIYFSTNDKEKGKKEKGERKREQGES